MPKKQNIHLSDFQLKLVTGSFRKRFISNIYEKYFWLKDVSSNLK